jgi:2-polyprenyl-3-methyl-5-hydroxy-6-metoxy-1,4-benzoquinol methylase
VAADIAEPEEGVVIILNMYDADPPGVRSTAVEHLREVAAGDRFEFGKNWSRFLTVIDDDRIRQAEHSLSTMLGFPLEGKSFIDVGSGSGLFSLVARRLGARVHSFDYDAKSVACTRELRRRYFTDDPLWRIEQGSALDPNYLASLGKFDVIYSWGVLHHTGAMWQALENVTGLVAEGGTLFIAIYNDQGKFSRRWTRIKKFYNRSPKPVQLLCVLGSCAVLWWRPLLKDLLRLRPFESWRRAGHARGMSAWWDAVDWVGGYPFEVAKPEEIFDFYHKRGFALERLRTEGGSLGCNEFVFTKFDRQNSAGSRE